MNRATVSASSRCSSVRSKFMMSQAEYGFGDDVALYLVGAAEDGNLAHGEVVGRGGIHPAIRIRCIVAVCFGVIGHAQPFGARVPSPSRSRPVAIRCL